uniref:Gnk2-homologous domain-containing protein n=1 Tax=Fagus sylvatica TaxID=28930 RepID=A0A2N9H5Z1_FAGSY
MVNGFYNFSAGENSDKVNAIALCRADLTSTDCRSCVNMSAHELLQLCPNQKEVQPGPAETPSLDSLRYKAAGFSGKFATGSNANNTNQNYTIYALMQCTPDLVDTLCQNCLTDAQIYITQCCNDMRGARVLTPSCNLRYETNRFYGNTTQDEPPPGPPPSLSPPPPPLPPPAKGCLKLGMAISTRSDPTAPTRRGDRAVAGYRNCPDTRGGAVTDFVCPAPPRPEDISIIAPSSAACRPPDFLTQVAVAIRNSESPTKHELESPTARWQRRQRSVGCCGLWLEALLILGPVVGFVDFL